MSIESDIFKRSIINISKLIKYGFKKDKDIYIYENNITNDFKAIITINKSEVHGKVIDLLTNEEYLLLRTDMVGEFVNGIRDSYKKLLIDIRNNCFDNKYFVFDQSNRITKYIKDKYSNDPEFLWEKDDETGVFRKTSSKKWYGIIMYIDISKIDKGEGKVEVINIKLDRDKIQRLLTKKGYYPAYHMNKKDWITIILNDTLGDNEIFKLIDESYSLVK